MKMTHDRLLTIVENYFTFEITSKSRKREKVYARFIFFKLCQNYAKGFNMTRIGSHVNRDHSSVIYALRQFGYIINQDEIFKKDYHNLVDECELEKTKLDKLINNSIKVFGVIRIVHPLKRYAQKKSVYKILEQRRSSTKCSDELF